MESTLVFESKGIGRAENPQSSKLNMVQKGEM